MQKLYKLSFPSKADWETFSETLKEEENNWISPIATVIVGGHLPKKLEEPIIDEDGNENWYGIHSDYAVDIVTDKATDMFNDYLAAITGDPLMRVEGGQFETIS